MDDEEVKLKIKFKKVDDLISLRTSIMYVVIVIFGGTVGLAFTKESSNLKTILICLGIFYFIVLISNIVNLNEKIDRILFSRKEFKKWITQ